MDYKEFRFRAEVDFIDIRFDLERATRFDAVQRLLEPLLGYKPHVKRIDEGAAGETKCFEVRIQDPQNWLAVEKAMRAMSERYTFARDPKVTAIEVALDAYHESNDPIQLAAMAAHMYRGCTLPVSANHRVYRYPKHDKRSKVYKPQGVPEPEPLMQKLLDGWQIGIGNHSDDLYQHGYVKTTDRAGEVLLPANEHRARFEIRIQGAEIDVLEFPSFSHSAFGKYFKFRIEDEEVTSLDPFRKSALSKLPQIGERKPRRVKGGKTVLYRQSVKADAELNERARWAIKNLAKRWAGRSKTSPAGNSEKPSDCRNSGSGDMVEKRRFPSVAAGADSARSNNYICTIDTSNEDTQASHQDTPAGLPITTHDMHSNHNPSKPNQTESAN